MANRSYLYTCDALPSDPAFVGRGVSQFNTQVPLLHQLMVAGNPRAVASAIWDGTIAIVADRDGAFERTLAFLDLLGLGELPNRTTFDFAHANARTFLSATPTSRYLLLEAGEIFELGGFEPEEEVRQLVATSRALGERVDRALSGGEVAWLNEVRGGWAHALGVDAFWSEVLYYSFRRPQRAAWPEENDEAFAFARRFPRDRSLSKAEPDFILAIRDAFEELRKTPTARVGAGVVRLFEVVSESIAPRFRDANDLGFSLAKNLAYAVDLAVAASKDVGVDAETCRSAALGIWNVVKSDAHIFWDVPRRLGELCPSEAVASAVADGLLAAAPSRPSPRYKRALFLLLETAGRIDEMRAHNPSPREWTNTEAIALAYERAGRPEDALAVLDEAKPSAARDVLRSRLLLSTGRKSDALAATEITPKNAAELATIHGLPLADIVRLGRERASDKGPWLERALKLGDVTEGLAILALKAPFHPEALDTLIGANPELPRDLAFAIATRAAELALDPATEWHDTDRARRAAIRTLEVARSLSPSDAARQKFEKALQKRVDKTVNQSTSFFLRELAFAVSESLEQG